MPNQWLATEVVATRSNGSGTGRTITMSGMDTSVREVPTITRTNTTAAISRASVSLEDEGCTVSFKVKIRSLLASVPDGGVTPPNPI